MVTESENTYSVYMHTAPNGKRYIGITKRDPEVRWKRGQNYRHCPHFRNAVKVYGWDNIKHEVLFTKLSKSDACAKEKELIAKYNSNDPKYGYNLTSGGECGFEWSDETIRKMRETATGRRLSAETRAKIGEASRGRVASDETRRKLSEAHKGSRAFWYGKHIPKEVSDKMREKMPCKRVLCVETGVVFVSIGEAARAMNLFKTSISDVCNGKRKSAGGYHFKYAEVN